MHMDNRKELRRIHSRPGLVSQSRPPCLSTGRAGRYAGSEGLGWLAGNALDGVWLVFLCPESIVLWAGLEGEDVTYLP